MSAGRPEHNPSSWTSDQEELTFVHERSGLKPKEIQKRLRLTTNAHYYNVMGGKGGFSSRTRLLLRQLANETRARLGLDLLPEAKLLDLDQGLPIVITSKEIDLQVVKQIITKR